MSGFFPGDTKPWQGKLSPAGACKDQNTELCAGTIITSYCSEFENLDGRGHGVKLETTNMTVRTAPPTQRCPKKQVATDQPCSPTPATPQCPGAAV